MVESPIHVSLYAPGLLPTDSHRNPIALNAPHANAVTSFHNTSDELLDVYEYLHVEGTV